VLFLHGGLGDMRLFAPQVDALSRRFRCIGYDRRFYGRSTGPGMEWRSIDDAVGVLDVLGVDRAALVGLSAGAGLELDLAVARPDRVWAVVHIAGGVSGMPVNPYTDKQEADYDAAEARGDLETMMNVDFAVWAPLGAEDYFRELWLATPDARGLPDGASPLQPEPAAERLGDVAVPTLVVVPTHDPPAQQDVGRMVARRIPGARFIEINSDHYLTLRAPEQVDELLLEFLTAAAPH
jgi:3-oxoadipate enol-lactonase